MLFPTVGFALFFVAVFVAAWLLRPWPERWKAFLLLASIVFFGWWDWRAALVLAGLVAVAEVGAAAIHRAASQATRRGLLVAVLAIDVVTFVAVARTGLDGVALGPVVPLGIGLLVLRCISYVVDVHRGVLEPAPVLDTALALSFFPMVVAGPLARPSQLLPQLAAPPDARRIPAARAFRLLLVGLFAVWVVAPYLGAHVVDPVFTAPQAHSGLEAIAAVYGFTVQLFAVLAGYASMAAGAGLLLGIRLGENFDAPFTATTLRSFWRRWTVTFSAWFRDYVYLPLGGGHGRGPAVYRNLAVTMIAAGLWFVGGGSGFAWGVLMGLALVAERAIRGDAAEPAGGAALAGWLVTFNVVVLGFLVVRAGSLAAAGDVLARLGSWGPAPLVTPLAVLVIVGVVALQFLPRDLPSAFDVAFSRLPVALQGVALAAGLLVIDALSQGIVAPTVPARF